MNKKTLIALTLFACASTAYSEEQTICITQENQHAEQISCATTPTPSEQQDRVAYVISTLANTIITQMRAANMPLPAITDAQLESYLEKIPTKLLNTMISRLQISRQEFNDRFKQQVNMITQAIEQGNEAVSAHTQHALTSLSAATEGDGIMNAIARSMSNHPLACLCSLSLLLINLC